MTRDFRRHARAGGLSLSFVQELEDLDRASNTGVIPNDRISESSVTQHEAALSVAFGQVTGSIANAQVPVGAVTQHQSALSVTFGQITGVIAEAQVSEGAVTQHEAALSIAYAQLTGGPDIPAWYLAVVENTDTATDLRLGGNVPLTGATVHLDAGEYAISGDGIEVTTSGRHRVSAVVDWIASADGEVSFRFAVNGTETGPLANADTITAILDLASGDVVTLTAIDAGGTGTVTMASSGTSSLTIETWR